MSSPNVTTTLEHPCTECDGFLEPELVSIYPSSRVCLDCMPKSERSQLEKDLNQVQQLDRDLLPNLPIVNGWDVGLHYRPSRLLSGDFYDVRTSTYEDDGRLTIIVGDVMGKGIPAALLRAGLQSSLKALAPEVCAPAKVLEKANRYFLNSTFPGRLATVFFGALDTEGGQLRYANAGHFVVTALKRAEKILRDAKQVRTILTLYDRAFKSIKKPKDMAGPFFRQSNFYRVGKMYAQRLEEAGLDQQAAAVRDKIGG